MFDASLDRPRLNSSDPSFNEWASELKRCSLRRQKSARLRNANASLSSRWQTPKVTRSGYSYTRGDHSQRYPNLIGQAESFSELIGPPTWPTPTANMNTAPGGSREGGPNLQTVAELWPTPDASDGGVASRTGWNDGRYTQVTLKAKAQQWPTPDVPTGGSRVHRREVFETKGSVPEGKRQVSLEDAARYWPTPRAEDTEMAGNHPGKIDSLTGATKLWKTPTALSLTPGADYNPPGQNALGEQARLWATPTLMDSEQAGGMGATNRTRGESLDYQATRGQQWATPNARDHKGTDLASRRGGASLSHQAQTGELSHSGRLAQTTWMPGDGSSSDGPSSPPPSTSKARLNPLFVEWLMGFDIGWTGFARWETPSFPSVAPTPCDSSSISTESHSHD